MKRWIALVLVLVMAVGALPMAALATTNTPLGTYGVFLLLQKYVVSGVTSGGVKG